MARTSTYFMVALLGAMAIAPATAATAPKGNPGIVPIGSKITTVKSYADLGAEWWQWAVQAPAVDSPLFDPTGAKCRVGQEAKVWFLATTLGYGDPEVPTTRQCEIPGNTALFFPIINAAYFAFLNDPPETRTAAAIRAAADASCDTSTISNLSVTIDGRPVARPDQFVTSVEQSPLFQAQLPTDNIYGAVAVGDPETELVIQDLVLSPAAHKGFYIFVEPLTPGNHTIEWTATWECSWGPMSENMRYELNVLSGVAGLVE
jgi:hypothetical protein